METRQMVKLTPKISELLDAALADGTPCLVGTASKDGHPQISPKGSVAMYDDHTLCYWERSHRSSSARLKENPFVVIFYRNPARAGELHAGGALRFHGKVRVIAEGDVREAVWNKTNAVEQSRDPEKKGVGVLVDLERVEELSGKVVLTGE
jgi:predicted pyridoxine 5'-phosphate oxidase superfamily flavin-nucleotide-binding protein